MSRWAGPQITHQWEDDMSNPTSPHAPPSTPTPASPPPPSTPPAPAPASTPTPASPPRPESSLGWNPHVIPVAPE